MRRICAKVLREGKGLRSSGGFSSSKAFSCGFMAVRCERDVSPGKV